MDIRAFEKALHDGEGVTIEFKRCQGQARPDTFETICSFANHAGGNVFLGVEDDSTVIGVPSSAILDIERNISNIINNQNVFKPAVAIEFDHFIYDNKHIIRIWVPVDSFVHSYKNTIFDRLADSDIRLNMDAQISALYLRKQTAYTEQKIYPYVAMEDLELDLLDEIRAMAVNRQTNHPWAKMSDESLLRSANLFTRSYATGEEGFNLAAVLLLGKEDVISSIVPHYKTDALLRIDTPDRYDDRMIVRSNLIRAYPALSDFCKKHLKDRFYLEGGQSISPRDIIVRELISNTLIHREYSSPFPAKVIITESEMQTENGSRASFDGPLNLAAFNPMPKNPLIASFFSTIGWADELGSGSRNLLKYARVYSGGTPSLIEGNVFKALVPIEKKPTSSNDAAMLLVEQKINEKGFVTTVDLRDGLGITHKTAQRELAKLVENGVIQPVGNTRGRKYVPAE